MGLSNRPSDRSAKANHAYVLNIDSHITYVFEQACTYSLLSEAAMERKLENS